MSEMSQNTNGSAYKEVYTEGADLGEIEYFDENYYNKTDENLTEPDSVRSVPTPRHDSLYTYRSEKPSIDFYEELSYRQSSDKNFKKVFDDKIKEIKINLGVSKTNLLFENNCRYSVEDKVDNLGVKEMVTVDEIEIDNEKERIQEQVEKEVKEIVENNKGKEEQQSNAIDHAIEETINYQNLKDHKKEIKNIDKEDNINEDKFIENNKINNNENYKDYNMTNPVEDEKCIH